MNALFGLELPTPVNFVIAFVVVLGLIGAATWLVRRFGATRLEAGGRNRQPRLAVLDSAAVDGRRKLVIIRRDNVEHLLMIGGPTDVVVETNIVRSAAPVARDAPAVRVNGGEPLPRAIPLPDSAAAWPLQPEPAVPPAPAVVTPPVPVRAERAQVVEDPDTQWPAAIEPVAERIVPAEPVAAPPPPPPPPQPRPAPAPRPAPRQAPPVQVAPVSAADDANLATMAHQLEAALRRPAESAKPAAAPRRIEPKLAPVPAPQPAPQRAPQPAPKPAPRPAVAAAGAAAPAAAAPSQDFESLEQEMASLLGRPGKS